MGPSEKAFQQVRNILGKLDRNIDQLRTTRTAPVEPPPQPVAPAGQSATSKLADRTDRIGGERPIPGSQAGASTTHARASSAYGRATPIPPSGH